MQTCCYPYALFFFMLGITSLFCGKLSGQTLLLKDNKSCNFHSFNCLWYVVFMILPCYSLIIIYNFNRLDCSVSKYNIKMIAFGVFCLSITGFRIFSTLQLICYVLLGTWNIRILQEVTLNKCKFFLFVLWRYNVSYVLFIQLLLGFDYNNSCII